MQTVQSKGFTLVELLVVISIISILSVIGLTVYSGIQSRARDVQRLDDARKIVTVLEQFKSGAGRYPASSSCAGWCNSTSTQPWISEIDVSNFRNSLIPIDPTNTTTPKELIYSYVADSADPNDYCLVIPQENNVAGHPYFETYSRGSISNGVSGGVWHLRFGPLGPGSGFCRNK